MSVEMYHVTLPYYIDVLYDTRLLYDIRLLYCTRLLYCIVSLYDLWCEVTGAGGVSSGLDDATEVSDCTLPLVVILPRFLALSELSSIPTAMSLSFSPFLLIFLERFPCSLPYLILVYLDEDQKEKETIEMSVEMYHVTLTFFYWTYYMILGYSIVLYCHVIYGMVSLVLGDFSSGLMMPTEVSDCSLSTVCILPGSLVLGDFSSGPDDATEVSDCSLTTVCISYGFLVFRLYRGRKVSGFASDLPPLLLPVFPLSYWHR